MQQLRKPVSTTTYLGHGKFFRARLLTLKPEDISSWIDSMEKEADNIRREALKQSWYMRGGLSYEQALNLSYNERLMINELIKENLDTTKKSGLPFF